MKEFSLKELAEGLNTGKWTSRDLVKMYLDEINKYDVAGPKLNAIAEINPDAYKLADLLDKERSISGPRSVLHGIPIVIKDNINTGDLMHTTASSYALKNYKAPEDAFIVQKLRDAGMIILAKTNLSEFAYFMSFDDMPSGYGSLNGQVRSPYSDKIDPLGSSTGSAVAVASNFSPVSIGTETNGSLTAPAQNNSIVSIKPTLGLISRTGIIPISHLQDTAGPMSRTVEDSAILLEYLVGKDPKDKATSAIPKKTFHFSKTYNKSIGKLTVAFLKYSNVKYTKEEVAIFEEARALLKPLVLNVVNIELELPELENHVTLIYDFKHDLNNYFKTYKEHVKIKSLKELIEFNKENKERCLKYGQSIFEAAEKTSGTLEEKEYLKARSKLLQRANKFTELLVENNIDVLVIPRRTSHAPVAGNPVITVPAKALKDDLPISLFFIAKKFDDELCIRVAYHYEQLTKYRLKPNLEAR
ncbi:MAG: amidase [Tenericutes bacterium]|nr:amidase [Mycoplasmatota bacterium]